jgi:hypothetical protein
MTVAIVMMANQSINFTKKIDIRRQSSWNSDWKYMHCTTLAATYVDYDLKDSN